VVSTWRKALIAAVPAVIAFLSAVGVVLPEDIESSAVAAITGIAAVLVYLVPND
jgi:hypothetical protein